MIADSVGLHGIILLKKDSLWFWIHLLKALIPKPGRIVLQTNLFYAFIMKIVELILTCRHEELSSVKEIFKHMFQDPQGKVGLAFVEESLSEF